MVLADAQIIVTMDATQITEYVTIIVKWTKKEKSAINIVMTRIRKMSMIMSSMAPAKKFPVVRKVGKKTVLVNVL